MKNDLQTMDRQKLPPPVSTKITRKLASESTEHNSLLNFYSSISTDETGAPKRWKMSSSVQIDEDVIASGKSSPVPQKGTSSRDSSSERKGRLGTKRGGKEKDTVESSSSRESSLEKKEKGKMIPDSKRESSVENSFTKVKAVDKSKFYGSTAKVNGDSSGQKKGRPKSLDLNSKLINGDEDSFKSPDPLTPCNITVKRRKGRPKETPPTLVAEDPVESISLMATNSNTTQTEFDNEETDTDIEYNIEPVVKKKPGRKPKLKPGDIPKSKTKALGKVLGSKKQLKRGRLISKLKKGGSGKKIQRLETNSTDSNVVVRRKAGRPPGAKNKKTLYKEQLAKQVEEQQLREGKMSESLLVVESGKGADSNSVQDETIMATSNSERNKIVSDLTSGNDAIDILNDKLNSVAKSKRGKAFGVKRGRAKSLGKIKKESEIFKKIQKKRILTSYAANKDRTSLDHLPHNDLRRYLQMKLIEKLNGNRSNTHTMMKPFPDSGEISEKEDSIYSEEDSNPAPDPMKYSDIQNLSALVEQKRVRSESDASAEQRQLISRSRKSSLDFSKISDCDNESVSSEISTNSINSSKRILVLGEDNPDSDDTIRTRQRVEIVPGKTRKRTLSGEFDLVDEYQLRKEQKLARLSGPGTFPGDVYNNDSPSMSQSETTPNVSPVKVKVKTSPKIAAIIQRMDAKKEYSSPFVTEHRKRLSKQSPFLKKMRIKKLKRERQGEGNRRIKMSFVTQTFEELNEELKEIQPGALKTEQLVDEGKDTKQKEDKVITSQMDSSQMIAEVPYKTEVVTDSGVSNTVKVSAQIHSTENESELEQSKSVLMDDSGSETDPCFDPDDFYEEKPFVIETEVHNILMELIGAVITSCEPETNENEATSFVQDRTEQSEEPVIKTNLTDMLSDSPVVKKRAGRPKKQKKHFGRKKMSNKPSQLKPVIKRKRKPKSAQAKESPDSVIVRKFELRQKISRSPLDNIALKQSIEESEYYKSEAQRANRKEAKQKAKRSSVNMEGQINCQVGPLPAVPIATTEITDPAPTDFAELTAPTEVLQTETETESEISDEGFDSSDQFKTMEDYLSECRPCRVVLSDFIKQLQLAQHNTSFESVTETDDSMDNSTENIESPVKRDATLDKNTGSSDNKVSIGCINIEKQSPLFTEKVFSDYSSILTLSKQNISKAERKAKETSHKYRAATDTSTILETEDKTKISPPRKKSSSPKVKKSSPENQTARKTVPPLKIKLKGGLRKTYMVESCLQPVESVLSPPPLDKPVKKKKSKSSSKSGSDSDRGNKGHHHHHHHKKRNKSPLAGQVGLLGEKKSKPTAIVAASPSVKQSPVPKDPYEATFLEFIQNKEKDLGRLPLKPKHKLLYEETNKKEYKVDNEGSLMVTASSQSHTNMSLSSDLECKTQASVCSSISKNTSLVNSVISDSLKESVNEIADDNQKKDRPLFIGVLGPRSHLQYFCSVCENEIHKTDDLVLKHFALVHPGEPIMYRRVADKQQRETAGTSIDLESTKSTLLAPESQNIQALPNDKVSSNLGTSAGDLTDIPSQVSGGNQTDKNKLHRHQEENKRTPDKEEDEESDTGSLNLKIVEVVSLKDQLNAIDPIDVSQDKGSEARLQMQDLNQTNSAYTPELKIPHFPRAISNSGLQFDQTAQFRHVIQDKFPMSVKPLQRKPPGIITPGRLCNTFKCEKCNVHAPVLAAMVAHLRNTHKDIPRLFQCPYCRDKEAESEAQIHQHIRKYHPTDNPNPPVALSERAKSNLRTLSVRVPDNKANDASFLEKDIYMCLNCKTHMPSLEAIYDHLEQVHTEVFVFVCSSCKVFKSKSEKVVMQHIRTEPQCNTQEKNISLAIDGNQFTRVPCLLKEKNKNKEKTIMQQPKLIQTPVQAPVSKSIPSQPSLPTSNPIIQALQKQPIAPTQLFQPSLPMQQMQQLLQSPFGQILAPQVMAQQPKGQLIPIAMSQPAIGISSLSTITSPVSQITSTVSVMTSPVSQLNSVVSQSNPLTSYTSSSSTASSGSATSTSVGSVNTTGSAVPPKPAGAKKRKNLLESIQHLKIKRQQEQLEKMELEENALLSESGLSSSSTNSSVSDPSSGSQVPPPLIRGPPPLIRFDQLNQIPLSAAAPIQSGGIPQQIVKQVSRPIQMSKADTAKPTGQPRQIQSSLFDTSDPDAFKPVQRTPVLNVPSVPRSNRSPAQSSGLKTSQVTPSSTGSTPLDLSKTTPTNSPASTPPIPDRPVTQTKTDVTNPEVYNVFNLKPSTQAQLPKQALQNKAAVHQLPPKVPGPPQTVRPNTANTLAYRPQHPHITTTQVPQVINMPMGMLNTIGNIVVTMPPNFQVVQGMPAQYVRMSGTQLITSPAVPVSVAVAMPTGPATRPVLTSQQAAFQQPMNVNLPVFKCPYCPKLIPLTFTQVQPHIESQHPGCSVVFMPIENKK